MIQTKSGALEDRNSPWAKLVKRQEKVAIFDEVFWDPPEVIYMYSKTCLKWPLKKKTKIGFQDQLLLNAGQKICRMLQGEHSAILSTFIKLQFVIKIFVLSIFKWLLKTSFTVPQLVYNQATTNLAFYSNETSKDYQLQ